MNFRIVSTFITGFILTLAIPLSAQSAPQERQNCVTVITSGSTSRAFWSKVIEGATQAGKELGLKVYARGTVEDSDSSGQKFVLENTMKLFHCRGLVIAPSDASRNQDIAHLKAEGIPVIYIDRDTGGDRLASVTTDNYAAGQLAAQKMGEALGYQGNVLLFRLKKGVASTDARERGFADEAQKIGLTIVADAYLGTQVGDARSKSAEILEQFPHANGIFTPNDTTTIGVLISRESYLNQSNVIHIGFDEQEMMVESLKNGSLYGYMIQLPYKMGYKGVWLIHEALQGKTVEGQLHTPIEFISRPQPTPAESTAKSQ
ncbi:D-ribose-binding periplasmic protein precursor [Vibrio ruber DSM 16370]|uniref:Autoinducer 2-binding periplasmic protein LuxP n=1 Tax=Vibrio ruber (strain DSM 16370 / JCM 11486 / BCRC 17186 / CECT 7878 / LMG 23124 / VR1) TaxID=1123498 RepID=A0A1R4LT85_VIBR1|nr:substrate-binding domain-containing protein [Vibrio ruber]SJN59812.1 D-ribose-binding periplasmic protein precursor [Vibrio ruber DSM 16370]